MLSDYSEKKLFPQTTKRQYKIIGKYLKPEVFFVDR